MLVVCCGVVWVGLPNKLGVEIELLLPIIFPELPNEDKLGDFWILVEPKRVLEVLETPFAGLLAPRGERKDVDVKLAGFCACAEEAGVCDPVN